MHYSTKILQKLGLSDGEIAVYIAGLCLGPSLASDIAKQAKLSRTLVYHILEELSAQGLTSTVGKHGKKFIMEPPHKLKNLIERKRKELTLVEEQLAQAAVELESLYTPKLKPSHIRFYEGIAGMKIVAEDMLKTTEKMLYVLAPIEHLRAMFDDTYLQFWFNERNKLGIQSKSIWSQQDDNPITHSDFRDTRLVPENLTLSTAIIVNDNKVTVFSSPQTKFAFVIESAEFAETMKSVFNQIWPLAKPVVKVGSH